MADPSPEPSPAPRLGVVVPPSRPWSESREAWRSLDDWGLDVGYTWDHLTHRTVPGRWLAEGWATVAAAAASTARVDVGVLVASAALRRPVALARLAATVDDVSDGRMVLGFGAGVPTEAGADTGRVPEFGELSRLFHDTVEGLEAVWRGDTEWQGRELSFTGIETLPLPPGRRPPHLMLAAHGPRGLDLVARKADGWSTYGGPQSRDLTGDDYWAEVTRQRERLVAACETHDRDPATVRMSLLLGFGHLRPLASVEAYVDAVGRATQIGFTELAVYWPDADPDSPLHADPEVLREGVARLRS